MPAFDYRGWDAYHVVLLTQGRAPHLAKSSVAQLCMNRLATSAERHGFRLLGFCVMRDHLHALVLGADDAADLVRFVQHFKQATAFGFKRTTGRRLWQQSFYDRMLRTEEDLAAAAEYIFANPVHAGLVGDGGDYPFSGGEYFEADGAEAPSLRRGVPTSSEGDTGG